MKKASVLALSLFASVASLSVSTFGQQFSPANNKIPAATLAILEHADQFELLALRPGPTTNEGNFHGYKLLGAAKLDQAETRQKLISSLARSTQESNGNVALCFNPRHGIRATSKGKNVDLVICFECLQMKLYDEKERLLTITRSPETLFNQVLKQNGISPPSREEP